jgi:N12 class adenine-specific DNA methylase
MAGVDDIIGEWVKQAEASGELKGGRYWGKPFDLDDGFTETPVRLRMAYRILKNAGYVPHEVEMLNNLADLKEEADAASDPAERRKLDREVANLEAKIKLVVEGLNR